MRKNILTKLTVLVLTAICCIFVFFLACHGTECKKAAENQNPELNSDHAITATNSEDYIPGDLDGNPGVTIEDAIHLLFAINFPDSYTVNQPTDFNGSGKTDMDDAIYLLFHVNFPEAYPLYAEDKDTVFFIDITKISPMILENTSKEVVTEAKKVIEGFLRYENSVEIKISGNKQRFLNDMAYVIHCTCPMFGAFTDFNEVSSYNSKSGKVTWNFYVEKAEFDSKLQEFYRVTKTYLSNIKSTDSEAMRAMLLYYALIDDLAYDYGLIGENYEKLSKEEANLRSSPYYTLTQKSGICTNIAQAYMFLCTQADIACGTVLHTGGSGMHMWNVVRIDQKFYYCDPTWDANTSLEYFGITATDRASWAGGYTADSGSMLSVIIPEKYDITDSRFEILRAKLPVEISEVKVNRESQTITFVGYEYEFVFKCTDAA